MSRAFVKESDGVEPAVRTPPALPDGVRNYITPAGAAAFQARLDANRAARAELGEGAIDAERRRELDAEARWLEGRLLGFEITRPPSPPTHVCFGCTVEVEGERGRRRLRILGVDELDADGAISWLSPVAKALIGAQVGDEVVLRTPSGEETVEVVALSV